MDNEKYKKLNKENGHYGSPRVSSEYTDCSLPFTFDQYSYCSYKCMYCFAYYQKINNPSTLQAGGIKLKTVNIQLLKDIFDGKKPNNPYYKQFIKHRFPFHWGGLSEPSCNFERELGVGKELIKKLIELNYPTIFSTKGILFSGGEYYELFKKVSKKKNFAFQFSIITNNEKMAEFIEEKVPTIEQRFNTMKKLSDLGYWTVLRLRPFIIGVTDIGLETLLERAKKAGARAISTEFFCLDSIAGEEVKKRYKVISKVSGIDVEKYYKKLSPSERGFYRRLNRDVKENFVKRMWIKCHELGLQFNISDPDFKELNESGSCCGLPESRKQYDSELVNWTRGQLTYHLKELRKRYWKSNGKDKYLHWEMVEKDMANNWGEEHGFYGDSLRNWHSDYAKTTMGYKDEFIQIWNNTRSSANPYNYFHGKLKPSYVDKNKNIVFEYVPHDYEKRWKKEGIL